MTELEALQRVLQAAWEQHSFIKLHGGTGQEIKEAARIVDALIARIEKGKPVDTAHQILEEHGWALYMCDDPKTYREWLEEAHPQIAGQATDAQLVKALQQDDDAFDMMEEADFQRHCAVKDHWRALILQRLKLIMGDPPQEEDLL